MNDSFVKPDKGIFISRSEPCGERMINKERSVYETI